jgi:hypothetical protein
LIIIKLNMKSLFLKSGVLILFLLIGMNVLGQTPNHIPYQAVIRGSNGNLLTSQMVSVKVIILDSIFGGPSGGPSGSGAGSSQVWYSEIHQITTSPLGLIHLNIGEGNSLNNIDFKDIEWNSGDKKYIAVELDINGGNNFVPFGSQLLGTVPFAFIAQKTLSIPDGNAIYNCLRWSQGSNSWTMSNTIFDSGNAIGIGTNSPNNIFSIIGNADISGNVGIGEASPSAKLHVDGNVKINGNNTLEFGASIVGKQMDAGKIGYNAFGNNALDIVGAGNSNTTRKVKIFAEGGTEISNKLNVGNSSNATMLQVNGNTEITGNIGIGVVNPSNKLSVNGSADVTGNMGIGVVNPSNKLSVNGNVDVTGNMGVGVVNPSNKLSVNGNVDVTGNMGVGVSNPTSKLHIDGSIKINSSNHIELGAGNTKEVNAGKIGYQIFTTDALDIVGAGTTGSNRKVKIFAEGGTEFTGQVTASAQILGINAYTLNVVASSNNTLIFNNINFNTMGAGAYNTSNGVFTAPKSGYYRFIANAFSQIINTSSSNDAYAWQVRVNDIIGYKSGGEYATQLTNSYLIPFTRTIFLNAGDNTKMLFTTTKTGTLGFNVSQDVNMQIEYIGK